MRIEHVAIWVSDLEKMKDFYVNYFKASGGEKYLNLKKEFSSYFLSFSEGARLEIMQRPDISGRIGKKDTQLGFTHLAVSVGSKEKVIELTETIRRAGFEIAGEPRTTGDGYFEGVILDPEGNSIEITE